MMQHNAITFEQPLNEYIRVCLRLEHLFEQIKHNINDSNAWSCRIALSGMLEALNVIDRPDLKSKFTKALSQHANALAQLETQPNVDSKKLREILDELDQLTDSLYKAQDKMGHQLRTNNFLNSIRQHMGNPGGACAFSTPSYHLWLEQPAEVRTRNLKTWYTEFEQLKTTVRLLLQLTRGSTHPQALVAIQGFYQQSLDPKLGYHLVRVTVPSEKNVYPEISVGKHRLSVRFMELNTDDRPIQTNENIHFDLTCCLPLVSIS